MGKFSEMTSKQKSKIYIWALVIAFIPYFILCFYSFPSSDDYYTLQVADYDNMFTFIKTMFGNAFGEGSWNGTYAHNLIKTLSPNSFGTGVILFQIAEVLIILYVMFSIINFIKKFNSYFIGMEDDKATLFACIMVFIMFDTTCTRGVFYGFWAATVNYPLIFGVILNSYVLLAEYFLNIERYKHLRKFLIVLCSVIIILSNISQALLYLGIMSFIVLMIVIKNGKFELSNLLKYKFFSIYYIWCIALFALNFFSAIGGRVAHETGLRGMSLISAYLNYVSYDVIRLNLPMMLIVFLFFLPYMYKGMCEKKLNFKFNRPIIFTILLYFILSVAYLPALYSTGSIEPRNLAVLWLNNYTITFVVIIYWVGYMVENSKTFEITKNKNYFKGLISISVAVFLFLPVNGNKPIVSTVKNLDNVKNVVFNVHQKYVGTYATSIGQLMNGKAKYAYDIQEVRQKLFENTDIQYLEVNDIDEPWIYVTVSNGQAPAKDPTHWNSSNYANYFNKEILRGNFELPDNRAFRARGEKTGVVINESDINNFEFEFTDVEINDEYYYETEIIAKNITDINTNLYENNAYIVFFDDENKTTAFPIYLLEQIENDLKLYVTLNDKQLVDGRYTVAIIIKDDNSKYYSKNESYIFEKSGDNLYLVK